MSLNILVNGVEYTNFENAETQRSVEALCGSFSFASSADENEAFPVKVGDTIQILVDEESQLNGFIEGLEISYSANDHTISVRGRNKLGDLVDSTVGEIKEFTGAVSLVDIAKTIISGIGFTDVEVINNAGVVSFDAFDITSAEVGQKAFEFLELYARKKQILVTNDGNGNLVLTRASTEVFPAVLTNKKAPNNTVNNILSSTVRIDNAQRYRTYINRSQLNPHNVDAGVTPRNLVEQLGLAVDGAIRNTRTFEFNAEESLSSESAVDRAKWEATFRKAKSLSYTATVQGHSVNGQIWTPNILVRVEDEFANLSTDLMIRTVRFRQSVDEGSTTMLEMTYKDAYTLELEEDSRNAAEELDNFF